MIVGKKEFLAKALDAFPSFLWFPGKRWEGLVVFNYHRVGESRESLWDQALWSATAEAFQRHVRFLKQNFEVLAPADLGDLLTGRIRRAVMLTFDDGYRDNYDLAFPILKSEGLPATFFITSGFIQDRLIPWWDEITWMVHTSTRVSVPVGPWTSAAIPLASCQEEAIRSLLLRYKSLPQIEGEDFLNWLSDASGSGRCPRNQLNDLWMTWDMLREMKAGGMAIGGHTATHPVLSQCTVEQQQFEVESSKQIIESELGTKLIAFSYPVGQKESFSETTKQIVRNAGYLYGFSFYGGHARTRSLDLMGIPRVAVSPAIHQAVFRGMARSPSIFAR